MSKRNTHEAKARRRISNQSGKLETYEPQKKQPEDYVKTWMTDDTKEQCIGLEIGGVTHYIHAVTGAYLINVLRRCLTEWDNMARSYGAGGLLRRNESEEEYRNREITLMESVGFPLVIPDGFVTPDDWRFDPE